MRKKLTQEEQARVAYMLEQLLNDNVMFVTEDKGDGTYTYSMAVRD